MFEQIADQFIGFVTGWLRSAAIGPVLWLLVLGLFTFVMSWNFRRVRTEEPPVRLDEGEQEIDRIAVLWPWLRTQTYLTSRRVIQGRYSWFLSKRKIKSVSLDDVHSIVWRRYTNWFLLIVGIYFLNTFNPLALLLILFGLQSKVYTIRFATPFAQMPYTRIVVTTTSRQQLASARRFYERAVGSWSRMIAEKRLAAAVGGLVSQTTGVQTDSPVTDQNEGDFAWGGALLFYTTVTIVLAVVQRIQGPHVSFDDYGIGPLYIGLVSGVAARNRRDGLWLALLGSCALFTVKFPGSGILSLAADGGSPLFEEYFILLGGLGVVALASNAIATLHPMLAVIGILPWIFVPALTSTGSIMDFSLFTKVLLAMGWCGIFQVIDEGVRARLSSRRSAPPLAWGSRSLS